MSISYKMVLKKQSLVTPPTEKYYPCAIHEGMDDLDSLSKRIALNSNISKADCYRIVMSLTKEIEESLAMGRVVHIMTLGSFKINIHGKGVDSPEDSTKAEITGAKIIYNPSPNMNETLGQLTYKRIK
ncbi:HU family DNA-binding protein [Flavobacterium soyangense]|uniref:HU family DNA-binding protein n=1 Tax=Flavobacterium soyangense TaxID=2023265 RepID=A0A930UCC9_9FLAO|nr:HU family DNA-binding protein [Flavobacterium soyangense]MBF2708237.1 HU family DNA-binding protein [Flavobacterium soyangense]